MAINVIRLREIQDLVLSVLDDYGDAKFTQIAQDLQRYEFYSYMLNEDRMDFQGGAGIKRQIMTKTTGVAEAIGFHQARDIKIADHMAQMDVQWKHYQAYWSFDIKETFHNRGDMLIFNVIKPREANAIISLAALIESDGWGVPASTDEKSMYGVPYWVVYNNGNGGDFNGGAPSGHTTVGGINLSAHPNYKNYTDDFVNLTPDDWLEKARLLRLATNFVSPVTMEDFRGEPGQRWRIYTDKVGHVAYARMADQHNQNIGWDLARRDGQMAFGGNAIRHIPKLDSGNKSSAVPNDPWYFIDRGNFTLAAETMNYMRRTEPTPVSGSQPDSLVVYLNLTLQTFVENRRAHGVLATSA